MGLGLQKSVKEDKVSKAAGISSFGIAPQYLKGSAASADYNYMKAHEVGLAIVQDVRTLDPEIGGSLFRDNAFKAGVRVAGPVRLTPRADDLGWLLYALCGATGSPTGSAADGYTHTFNTAAGDESSLPWASLRKSISETWWETYRDCKLASMRFNIPAAGALTVDTTWLGIYPSMVEEDPTWGETYSTEPFLVTAEGYIEVPDGTEINSTGITIDFVNDITDDEEVVVGSYYLDDPTCLARMCTITAVHKIEDENLYQQIFMGGTAGTTWSTNPYIASADIRVMSNTSQLIGSNEVEQYQLQFYAPSVLWVMEPVTLRGNDIIAVRLTGSVLYDAAGTFYFKLKNDVASYTWL